MTTKTLKLYTVTTEKFGDVTIQAYDIFDARRDARLRFGVTNPGSVCVKSTYVTCQACDSAPCVCEARS